MNFTKSATLAILALGCCCAAMADEGVEQQALESAQQSGKPVLLIYTEPSTCPLANGATSFLRNSGRKLTDKFVVAEVPIASAGDVYHRCRRQFKGDFIPFWSIVTPEGEFIDGGDYGTIGSGGNSDWTRRVKKVAANCPAINQAARKKADRVLEQARKMQAEEKYDKALDGVATLQNFWFPKKLIADCKSLVADIRKEGDKRMIEADELANQEKLLEATVAYDRIATDFGDRLSIGGDARKKRDAILVGHPDLRGELLKARRAAADQPSPTRTDDAPTTQPDEADSLFSSDGDAASLMSETAAEPQKPEPATTEVKTPPKVALPSSSPPKADDQKVDQQKANEQKAGSLLDMAITYHASGMDEQAADYLSRCVRDYPNSIAALKARQNAKDWGLKLDK